MAYQLLFYEGFMTKRVNTTNAKQNLDIVIIKTIGIVYESLIKNNRLTN